MADETVVPSTTETTETTTEQTPEVEATPAEATTTETTATPEAAKEEEKGPIPYDRFAEINDERKASGRRVKELERELEQEREAKAPETAAPSTELTEPPEHLSTREKVDFYVRQGAERLMQDKLGMNLDQVKTLLQTIPGVSDAT